MYAITIQRDGSRYRKSIPKAMQTTVKLNSTLGFSKHTLPPETLTWSKKSRGYDSLNFKSCAKKAASAGGGGGGWLKLPKPLPCAAPAMWQLAIHRVKNKY